jgi:hypothetical protein
VKALRAWENVSTEKESTQRRKAITHAVPLLQNRLNFMPVNVEAMTHAACDCGS